MIRPIDIRINAAHPDYPLAEAVTFTGSPSTVLIRGVPPNCGRWAITAVFVAATFPDGSTTTRAAVQSANGVWVATLPATARSGRTANGLRVMADGIDENGEAVTGYILGVADFAVASLGVTPAPEPGETSWQMLYFDAVPGTLRKGDVTKVDGVLKLYNGTAWEAFANIDPSNFVPTSRTINGKALTDNVSLSGADIPTTAAPNSPTLSGSISTLNDTKASKSDATLAPIYSDTPTFSEWVVPQGYNQPIYDDGVWAIDDNVHEFTTQGTFYSVYLEFSDGVVVFTATRTRTDILGYTLGSQTDKPLAAADPLLFAQYYPEGNVKSAAEFTPGIKYGSFDDVHRTVFVLPFCNTGNEENDNSNLSGRVVIPPFVDASGNGYISDNGTRYKVVEVSNGSNRGGNNNLTAIVAPTTVVSIRGGAFTVCVALTSVSLPATTLIESDVFSSCNTLTTVSLPSATAIEDNAFYNCTSLSTVDFGDTPRSSVPSLGENVFYNVPTSCTIIVPYTQYDSWIAADGWKDMEQEFVRHPEKADKPATFTAGNLAKFDAQGNPADSTIPAANVAVKGNIPYDLVIKTVTNGAVTLDDRASNSVTISATLSPNTLTINFPTAPTGKLRDFSMRLNIAAGVTAPELVWPQGVVCENADGKVPEISDGGTGGSSTILYFSETENNGTTAKFLVKSEMLTAITQA